MAFRGALALLLLVAAAAGAAQAQLLTSAANALEWACSIPATDSGAYVVGTACFAQCDTTADPSITGRVATVCEWGTWRTIGACSTPPPVCIKNGQDVCSLVKGATPGTCVASPRDSLGYKCTCEPGYVWSSRRWPTRPCVSVRLRLVLEKEYNTSTAPADAVVAAGGSKKKHAIKKKEKGGKWTFDKLPTDLPGSIDAIGGAGLETLATGANGSVLQSINGSDWTTIVPPTRGGGAQSGVAVNPDTKEAWTVGPGGINYRNNKGKWRKLPANKADRLRRWTYNDVCRGKMSGAKNTFAIGKGRSTDKTGLLYIWNSRDQHFARAATIPRVPTAIAALSDTWAWITGEGGYIGRWNGTRLIETPSGTNVNLNSVDVLDETTAWAVGDNGTTLEWDGKAWTPRPSPTNDNIKKVTVTGSDDAIASTTEDVLVWDGVRWTRDTSANKPEVVESAKSLAEGARRRLLQRDPRCWDDWSDWWCRAVAHFADYDWALER